MSLSEVHAVHADILSLLPNEFEMVVCHNLLRLKTLTLIITPCYVSQDLTKLKCLT